MLGRKVGKTRLRMRTRIRKERMTLWMLEQIHNSIYSIPSEVRRGEKAQTIKRL